MSDGQIIDDPLRMVNTFRTDRTQVNAKKWIEVIEENLKWCNHNGLDLIVRANDTSGQSIYLGHTVKKGAIVPKYYSYLTQKPSLQYTAWGLQDLAVLIQNIHLDEFANIKNKQTVKIHLEIFDNCFECGMPLDNKKHKVTKDPYQDCLMLKKKA